MIRRLPATAGVVLAPFQTEYRSMSRFPFAGLFLGLMLSPLASAQDIPADTEIVELESGLKYSVLTAGKPGASPKLTDAVVVHYTGWFEDGKVFDTSRKARQPGLPIEPAQFKVGGVVEGWNIALKKMTPGARWKLTIPSDLGYGDDGRQGIPGGATLIFEIELISFEAGPGLPVFRRPDPSSTKLPSGALLDLSVAGTGEPVAADNVSIFHYTVFSLEGEMLGSSLFGPGPIKRPMKSLNLIFLQEAAPKMAPGAQVFIEVSAEDNPGGAEGVVWHVSLLNKALPDVAKVPWKKTDSGLEFHVLAQGDGEKVAEGDEVTCHYTGWRTDGVLFDSSVGGVPSTFTLRNPGVIAGWVEGVPKVNVGGTVLLRIPPDLGYGDAGRQPSIPPGATLVFEVEIKGREDS